MNTRRVKEDWANKIKIVYEDENVIAVSKPAGLLVHGDGKSNEHTLSDWILENHPEMEGVGEPTPSAQDILRPGIVHRLDRDTSGILIIAKNQATHAFLKKQFQGREVKKVYKGIVYGNLRDDEGVIESPIGMSNKRFGLRSAIGPKGKLREAVTEYKVLKRFGKKYTFLEIRPRTGRMHQIRVHLQSIGHPVLCDPLYAPKRECLPEIGRLALHAASLEVTLPTGTTARFEADLPEDFERVLAKLGSL
jgi:23S rRNA pseudouridine1911/1915/1917 synthase